VTSAATEGDRYAAHELLMLRRFVAVPASQFPGRRNVLEPHVDVGLVLVAPWPSCEEAQRLLEQLDEVAQERRGHGSVQHPVVAGHGQSEDRAHDDRTVVHHRLVADGREPRHVKSAGVNGRSAALIGSWAAGAPVTSPRRPSQE